VQLPGFVGRWDTGRGQYIKEKKKKQQGHAAVLTYWVSTSFGEAGQPLGAYNR
jgi:hypothetical protein